ncbi:MAG TPA: hypothetical protein VFH45_09690 [Acidimicrobiales bacterium]|nr:hypothetical protein [Acidimicrobiales bacterium]
MKTRFAPLGAVGDGGDSDVVEGALSRGTDAAVAGGVATAPGPGVGATAAAGVAVAPPAKGVDDPRCGARAGHTRAVATAATTTTAPPTTPVIHLGSRGDMDLHTGFACPPRRVTLPGRSAGPQLRPA